MTVLAVSLLVLDYILLYPTLFGTYFFGKVTIALYWLLQIFFLYGPRISYRLFKHSRAQQKVKRFQRGANAADRARRRNRCAQSAPLRAVLSRMCAPSVFSHRRRPIRAPRFAALRCAAAPAIWKIVAALAAQDIRVGRVVLAPSALAPELHPETILMQARRLGPATSRMPCRSASARKPCCLAPVNVEDLLLRPSVNIDYGRLESFIKGKTVVVTGGGGSIGAEICCGSLISMPGCSSSKIPSRHCMRFEQLAVKSSTTVVEGRIADVRDRDRMFRLMAEFNPNLVERPRSSTCRCSSAIGTKASRPTCSARSMLPTRRLMPVPTLWS